MHLEPASSDATDVVSDATPSALVAIARPAQGLRRRARAAHGLGPCRFAHEADAARAIPPSRCHARANAASLIGFDQRLSRAIPSVPPRFSCIDQSPPDLRLAS